VGLREIGAQPERFAITDDGFGRLAEGDAGQPQIVVGLGQGRVQRDGRLEGRGGLFEFLLLEQRPAQFALGLGRGGLRLGEPPLTFDQFVEFALCSQGLLEVQAGLGVARPQLQNLAEVRLGFGRLLELQQRKAQIAEDFRIARLEFQRLAEVAGGLFRPLPLRQGDAKMIAGLGVLRPPRERLLEAIHRFVRHAERLAGGAQQIPDLRLLGVDFENLPVQLLGMADSTALVQAAGFVEGLGQRLAGDRQPRRVRRRPLDAMHAEGARFDRRGGAAMAAVEIQRNDAAEDVFRVAGEVLRIVKRRPVGVHFVAQRIEEFSQRVRLLRPVVFDVQNRLEAADRLDGALQNLALHAFDVDLHEVAGRQRQIVDAHDGHGIRRHAPIVLRQVDGAEVLLAAIVGLGHSGLAGRGARGRLVAHDMVEIVLHRVAAQRIVGDALRFEGHDFSRRADEPGQGHRVRADIGADVERRLPRLEQRAEDGDFTFRELAVQLERTADVGVVRLVDHQAITASFDLVHAGLSYGA
jgi:hypothetical protein